MRQYTLLLVDYEPKSIERMRQPLARAGYRVELATDGLAAIEAFHRIKPDLVLIEAMIPKKHGFEVCQEIKRTLAGKRTPVLITTAVYRNRRYRTQALHIYGCDDYIEKPISDEELLETVRRHLGDGAPAPAGAGHKVRSESGDPSEAPDPAEREIVARLDEIFSRTAPGVGETPPRVAETSSRPPARTKAGIVPFDAARSRRQRRGSEGEHRPPSLAREILPAGPRAFAPAVAHEPEPSDPPLESALPREEPFAAPAHDADLPSGDVWGWAALALGIVLGGWFLYGFIL